MADSGENSKKRAGKEEEKEKKKPTLRDPDFSFEARKEEEGVKEEEDDVTCPICKEMLMDPVVTRCNHYFCTLCAQKHHEKDDKCFECKEPTLGDFNESKEMQHKINENIRGMLDDVSETLKKAKALAKEARGMEAEVKKIDKVTRMLMRRVGREWSSSEWNTFMNTFNAMKDGAVLVKDMVEKSVAMMQEADATHETAMAKLDEASKVFMNARDTDSE